MSSDWTTITTDFPQQPSMLKSHELQKAISQELHGLSLSADLKTRLAGGCHFAALEHHSGIALLFSMQVCSPAFALLRPLFEAYVRGAWLSDCATDIEIADFASGNWQKTPLIDALIKRLEQTPTFSDEILSKSKTMNWEAFCGFTHSGIQQVGLCLTSDSIEINCSAEQIDDALNFAGACAIMAGHAVATLADNVQVAGRIRELGKAFLDG